MPQYTIRQGECLASIAARYGFFWKRLWSHANNAALRQKRQNPNILFPGDVVFLPDKDTKQEAGATEQRHRFRKKGTPIMLRIRMLQGGEPIQNVPYTLEIEKTVCRGTTDADGLLVEMIPPDAKRGKLLLGEEEQEFVLAIGALDPFTKISGVQARLNNLGFYCGDVDGHIGPLTKTALGVFQETYDLPLSGELNQATLDKLRELHGS